MTRKTPFSRPDTAFPVLYALVLGLSVVAVAGIVLNLVS